VTLAVLPLAVLSLNSHAFSRRATSKPPLLSQVKNEYFVVWKEIWNFAREDAVRQACGIRLLRKYMQILQGDMRASVISSMRSNFMVSTNNFHHDEEKDAIFAEALSEARYFFLSQTE